MNYDLEERTAKFGEKPLGKYQTHSQGDLLQKYGVKKKQKNLRKLSLNEVEDLITQCLENLYLIARADFERI